MKGIYLLIGAILLLMGGTAPTSAAPAQPQATYELVKNSIGSSGNVSAGIYALSSSIGQPNAGEVSAGIYTLGGGFWGGGVIVPAIGNYKVYLPLVLK